MYWQIMNTIMDIEIDSLLTYKNFSINWHQVDCLLLLTTVWLVKDKGQ